MDPRAALVCYVGQDEPIRLKHTEWRGRWNGCHSLARAVGAHIWEGRYADGETLAGLCEYDILILNQNIELWETIPIIADAAHEASRFVVGKQEYNSEEMIQWPTIVQTELQLRCLTRLDLFLAMEDSACWHLKQLGVPAYTSPLPMGTLADLEALPEPECPDAGEVFAYQSWTEGAVRTCLVANALGVPAVYHVPGRAPTVEDAQRMVDAYGFERVTVQSPVPYGELHEYLRGCTLAIDMDKVYGIHRFAVDCAVAGVPLLGSNRGQAARQLWPLTIFCPVRELDWACETGQCLLRSRDMRHEAVRDARKELRFYTAEYVNALFWEQLRKAGVRGCE